MNENVTAPDLRHFLKIDYDPPQFVKSNLASQSIWYLDRNQVNVAEYSISRALNVDLKDKEHSSRFEEICQG